MSCQHLGHVTVIFTHSHLAAVDVAAGRGPGWLVRGNIVADKLANWGAEQRRLPSAVRTPILSLEEDLFGVRMRIIRASLDALLAEGKLASESPVHACSS
eukprot:4215857-Pyramimonas_sp.AAC.1